MKPWTEILLKPEDTLERAIQVLQSGGMRIALVIDENRKLLGTVTDGDVRRALINKSGLDSFVKEAMNTNPTTGLRSEQSKNLLSRMRVKDLLHVPLVDEQGVLVGLETLQHLLLDRKYDNPVLLMAGGFGKRLHPLTENKPKPLLPVGDRPILETIIIQFIKAGFHKFYVSTHYKAEMVREHFGNGSDWGIEIEYIHEDNPLGTAGSLGLLPDTMPRLPILMMNGDLLTKADFGHLLAFHNEQGGLATMGVREYDFQIPYGVVNIEEQYATSIVEKPVQKFFINAGIYVLDPSIISNVDGYSYIDMPNLLEKKIREGERVNVFPIHEYWLDIGRVEEYENAHSCFNKEFNKS